MTATCTESIALSFENLIGVKFNSKHWPTPIGMMHRSVRIEAKYTTCPAALVKKAIREPLRPNLDHPGLPNKVIVYSNSRRKIVQFSEQLGEEFDHHDDLQNYDIITLVGTLNVIRRRCLSIGSSTWRTLVISNHGFYAPQVVLEMQVLILQI